MTVKSRGHRHGRLTSGVVGAASVAALMVCGLAFAAPAEAEGELPILGQALTQSDQDTAETTLETLISVHGVRRVDGATMVYWSVGYTPDATAGSSERTLLEGFGSQSTLSPPRDGTEIMGDVAIVDLAGRKAYTTLYTGDTLYDCICQSFTGALPDEPEPGTAYVASSAVAPIPDDLETVTVRVAGQIIPDVPVEDGAMEPVAKGDGPIVVGTGWPEVDQEAIQSVSDASAFVVPLTTHEVVEDSALSERSDEDSRSLDLSADVLFAVDKATLTGRAKKEIRAAAEVIKKTDVTGTVKVTGHTDSSGTDSHNQDLSERRARSVATALDPLLPSAVKLSTEGRGESDPIADNETDEGKSLNRRVTITLPGDK